MHIVIWQKKNSGTFLNILVAYYDDPFFSVKLQCAALDSVIWQIFGYFLWPYLRDTVPVGATNGSEFEVPVEVDDDVE